MENRRLRIHGIGCAFPQERLSGTRFGVPEGSMEPMGFRHVRHGADPDQTIPLWVEATRAALAQAECSVNSIKGIIAQRNGLIPNLAGAWLSLALAEALGIKDPFALDVNGAGCAGILQSLALVDSMARPDGADRFLLVGGGASGYSRRWFPDALAEGEPDPGYQKGLLVGDGAHAMIVGRGDPGRYEVRSVRTAVDAELGRCWRREGQNYAMDDADFVHWLRVAPAWTMKVIGAAMLGADVAAATPMFFVGTNSSREVKENLCRMVWKNSQDERYPRALGRQLEALAEHGHLFGGDSVANLCTIRDARLLQPDDFILCLELGGTYLYTAAVLRAIRP